MTGAMVPPAGGLEMKATWLAAQALSPLSKRLGGAAAAHLWFTPWRSTLTEGAKKRRADWLEKTLPFSVDTSAGRLSGFAAGDGPPVLLVHGWADEAATMGAFIEPLVEAGLSVAGVDMPAHGSSPGGKTDALDWADAIEAAGDALGGPISIIAHSMGAIASAIAIERGLNVGRAVFIAPAVRMRTAFETFKVKGGLSDASARALSSAIERRFGEDIWTRFGTDRSMATSAVAGLVIHDAGDLQVRFSESERLVNAWPGAQLQRTQGLGHNRILRDGDVLARVTSFLREDEISLNIEGETDDYELMASKKRIPA